MMIRRPLVVGGTGFIGLNIALALHERGLPVRITRRESSLTFVPRARGFELFSATLDERSLRAAMDGCDVVFFAAGAYPRWSVDRETQVRSAVEGVRAALAAARSTGVARFVFTSSSATVGPPRAGVLADENDRWAAVPDSVYIAIKLAMEDAIDEELRAARGAGPEIVTVCPTGCLGPYDYKMGSGFFLGPLASGRLPFFVDGLVDVIGVEDVAAAHVAAAERGGAGSRYLLGAHALTVQELLGRTAEMLRVRPPERRMPLEQARRESLVEEGRCAKEGRGQPSFPLKFLDMIAFGQRYDSGRATAELGLRPAPLERVLASACDWAMRRGHVPRAPLPALPTPKEPNVETL